MAFAGALRSARLVLTDSGGIQEEGPSLGKTVLVARERTERPTDDARNRIVGRSREGIRDALLSAWAEPAYAGPIPAPNPFGDGHAGRRIAELVLDTP
ncbi:MAG: UDP-N-acetylglucosamine 2-epimerase [Myxococcales bacterium]|nr:UDP-N-acetylglucosamine 2-epimerase [Myxococcales bacterium]